MQESIFACCSHTVTTCRCLSHLAGGLPPHAGHPPNLLGPIPFPQHRRRRGRTHRCDVRMGHAQHHPPRTARTVARPHAKPPPVPLALLRGLLLDPVPVRTHVPRRTASGVRHGVALPIRRRCPSDWVGGRRSVPVPAHRPHRGAILEPVSAQPGGPQRRVGQAVAVAGTGEHDGCACTTIRGA